ncbi:terminase large subunit [environmental Halophage eHP-14]|nr:terminase large subunit [environmental Halophage eHP-14]
MVKTNFHAHEAQRPAYESDARFRPIAAGRRSGKTTLAAAETVERADEGGPGWQGAWVTPGHSITETGFKKIDKAVPDPHIRSKKESPPYRHEFANGARLDYLTTGGTPNVSEGYDWVVIDEAAKGVPKEAWTQELRPTLSNTGGDAMFISTPDGKGWFHDWWHRGQSEDHEDVESFRWSTYDAPHIPDSEVDDARADIPDRIFRQEYLAEFLDATGGVFDVTAATDAYPLPDGVDPAPQAEPPYRLAADLARSEDYLAIIGLGVNGRVSHITRERGLSWPQIKRTIERVAEAHGNPTVAIDATRDNKLVADLERDGMSLEPVTFSAQKKQDIIENLAAGIEAGEVTIPEDTILTTELSVFEYETTRAGNVRYGAPDGHHDDTVDALAMAYDLRAGSGIPTARASFGESQTSPSSNQTTETIADILPDQFRES